MTAGIKFKVYGDPIFRFYWDLMGLKRTVTECVRISTLIIKGSESTDCVKYGIRLLQKSVGRAKHQSVPSLILRKNGYQLMN